jgi:hypothetical protein
MQTEASYGHQPSLETVVQLGDARGMHNCCKLSTHVMSVHLLSRSMYMLQVHAMWGGSS